MRVLIFILMMIPSLSFGRESPTKLRDSSLHLRQSYNMDVAGLPAYSITKDGTHADPMNLIVRGTRENIIAGMISSGWREALPITLGSALREAYASIFGKKFPHAPVSTQYAFGKEQDLAFEREKADARWRHHFRIWKVPGTEDLWVGAASEDIGILIDVKKRIISHEVAEDVDTERSYFAKKVSEYCGEIKGYVQLEGAKTGGVNAQRVPYWTDGRAIVVSLQACEMYCTVPAKWAEFEVPTLACMPGN